MCIKTVGKGSRGQSCVSKLWGKEVGDSRVYQNSKLVGKGSRRQSCVSKLWGKEVGDSRVYQNCGERK